MSTHLGLGYGSEWQLLRHMGRHRKLFDSSILQAIGVAGSIDWLDSDFKPSDDLTQRDKEVQGLEFIKDPKYQSVKQAWASFWPQSGNPHNWDAVGELRHADGQIDYLLLEAKAHLGEIASGCGANSKVSRDMITKALDATKVGLGVSSSSDWLVDYYQHANRLAVLWFLNTHGVPARLVEVFFINDPHPAVQCPGSSAVWETALDLREQHLALPKNHSLAGRVHRVFFDVQR